jgi:hypothetical protein
VAHQVAADDGGTEHHDQLYPKKSFQKSRRRSMTAFVPGVPRTAARAHRPRRYSL